MDHLSSSFCPIKFAVFNRLNSIFEFNKCIETGRLSENWKIKLKQIMKEFDISNTDEKLELVDCSFVALIKVSKKANIKFMTTTFAKHYLYEILKCFLMETSNEFIPL